MGRYIISAWEQAWVQYQVEAESEAEAREMYEAGDCGQRITDEHDFGDIADIADVKELSA